MLDTVDQSQPTNPTRQSRPWNWRHVTTMVTGGVAILLGLALLLLGTELHANQSDAGTDLGQSSFDHEGYALVSAPLDWSTESYLGGSIERVQFDASVTDPATDIFLGLTTLEDAENYLTGETRAIDDGHRFEYTAYSGTAPAVAPQDVDIWSAQSVNTEATSLTFSTADQPGQQVLVVINAAGEPLGSGEIASFGDIPSADSMTVGLLIGGTVVGLVGLVLLVLPITRAAHRRQKGRAV